MATHGRNFLAAGISSSVLFYVDSLAMPRNVSNFPIADSGKKIVAVVGATGQQGGGMVDAMLQDKDGIYQVTRHFNTLYTNFVHNCSSK